MVCRMGYFPLVLKLKMRDGGVDPRTLPGNALVKFRRWQFSSSRYPSNIRRLIKKYNIEVPTGYWIMDNKIRNLPRNRNHYRRKWFKGFSNKFLPDSDGDEESETTVSTVIEASRCRS